MDLRNIKKESKLCWRWKIKIIDLDQDEPRDVVVYGLPMFRTCSVVCRFLHEKKLTKEFAWNFVFRMESRLHNRWKHCRIVLGSLFYSEHKYLNDIKYSVKVAKSSQTCLMQVVHPFTSAYDENIGKVKETLLENRRVGNRAIA